MIEFKLTFCPQCGGRLTMVPAPPMVSVATMLCSACQLIFAEGRPSPRNPSANDFTALFIAPPRIGKDGSVIPAGIAAEAPY